jgi:hypothetical protein
MNIFSATAVILFNMVYFSIKNEKSYTDKEIPTKISGHGADRSENSFFEEREKRL